MDWWIYDTISNLPSSRLLQHIERYTLPLVDCKLFASVQNKFSNTDSSEATLRQLWFIAQSAAVKMMNRPQSEEAPSPAALQH